jgi:hypothetical protein
MTRFWALLLCLAPLTLSAEPDFQLLLPKGAQAEWVMKSGRALPPGSRFEVDPDGHAWVLAGPRVLLSVDGNLLVLDQPLHDLVFGGSQLVASTDRVAGSLALRKLKGGMAASVKPQMLLPDAAWRLAAGPEAAAFGFDDEKGRSFLFRVRDQRKILEWPQRILAAVGTKDAWFLSTPSGIERISLSGATQSWGSFPGGASSLAWVEGTGLAAAGPLGVGLFVKPGHLIPLSGARTVRVRARASHLYILVPEQGGVLRIKGLGQQ